MSPIRMRKLPGKNKWRVWDGKRIAAKATSKKNAEAQVRLLEGLAHGMKKRGS